MLERGNRKKRGSFFPEFYKVEKKSPYVILLGREEKEPSQHGQKRITVHILHA